MRGKRAVGLAVSLALVATLTPTVGFAAEPDDDTSDEVRVDPHVAPEDAVWLKRPDVVSAQVTAKASGEPVEVTSLTTETSRTIAQPDGTWTDVVHAGPTRVFDDEDTTDSPEGSWRELDATLGHDGEAIVPAVHLGGLALSAGGDQRLAVLESPDGEMRLQVGFPVALPEPVLDGERATYSEVEPGVDLVVEATVAGFRKEFVLHERPDPEVPVVFRLPIRSDGLEIAEGDGEGELVLVDGDGEETVVADPAWMWDAAVDEASGEPGRQGPVEVRLVTSRNGGQVLELHPDPDFLADLEVVYPVVVDPSVTLDATADTYVSKAYPNTAYWSATELRAGTYNGGSDAVRSFVRFGTSSLNGKHINSANLRLYNFHSYSCSARTLQVQRLTSAFSSSTTWNNPPTGTTSGQGTASFAHGYSSSCPAAWAAIPVTPIVQVWANGTTNHGFRIRAESETDNMGWKKFRSMEASSGRPNLVVNYNSYPNTVDQRSHGPSHHLSGDTYFVPATRPQLIGRFRDPDGGTGRNRYEVYDSAKTTLVTAGWGETVSSGSKSNWTTGTLTDRTVYHWRARGHDGSLYSKDYSSWIKIVPDVNAPTTPTITSTSHPSQDDWYEGRAISASWNASTDGTNGSGVAGYAVVFDQSSTTVPTGTTSTSRTFSRTVTKDGVYWLHVRSRDNVGNWGTTRRYRFRIGAPATTAPHDGETTGKWLPLEAQGIGDHTGVTFQYRRDPTAAWITIPAAAVTTDTGGTITWPVAMTGGSHTPLYWNVPATTTSFPDGPIWIRASFAGGGAGVTPYVLAHLDRATPGHTNEQIGPGSVNLLTGNYTITETDASVKAGNSDLGLTRTHNSRKPDDAGTDGPFGPQWTTSIPVMSALSAWSRLDVGDGYVELTDAEGDVLRFTRNANGTYTPDHGAEDLTLTPSTTSTPTPPTFTLRDLDHNTTTFTREGTTSRYRISKVDQASSESTTTYRFDGSGRVERIVAPIPAGVDSATAAAQRCSTMVAGCRELRLVYATSTTATGTSPGQLGDHVGRVSRVELRWHDGTLRTETLRHYRYDSLGRLREARDQRLATPLVTSYAYDTDGRLIQTTPPGEAPWNVAYHTTPSSEQGRLESVSRTGPNGTATTNVTYGIPLTGSGAPHQMGRGQVAGWAQSVVPADATAINPPGTGTDLAKATVHYIDHHGRGTNVANPDGGIATSEHDEHGNLTRELTAANRALALQSPPAEQPGRAEELSTTYEYSDHGVLLLSETGPEHDVVLADGEEIAARRHTTYTYDEGYTGDPDDAPRLVTTIAVGALIDGREGLHDVRVTKTDYDWTLRLPTRTIVDPGGLNIVRTTVHDPTTGAVTETRMPKDGSAPSSVDTWG